MASDDDDVQLPDLQVIQRYSLAVRGATASRAEVIAALEADLAWLSGGRRRTATPARTPAPVAAEPAAPAPAKSAAAKKLAAKRTPAPAKKAAAKTLASKPGTRAAAKKSGARRR